MGKSAASSLWRNRVGDNAIAHQQFQFSPQPANPPYLAFLGRMSPEKGPHHAIAIAKQTKIPLKMAGPDYFS